LILNGCDPINLGSRQRLSLLSLILITFIRNALSLSLFLFSNLVSLRTSSSLKSFVFCYQVLLILALKFIATSCCFGKMVNVEQELKHILLSIMVKIHKLYRILKNACRASPIVHPPYFNFS